MESDLLAIHAEGISIAWSGSSDSTTHLIYKRIEVEATYIRLEEDVIAGASDPRSEVALELIFTKDENWAYLAEWRHDFISGDATDGEFGGGESGVIIDSSNVASKEAALTFKNDAQSYIMGVDNDDVFRLWIMSTSSSQPEPQNNSRELTSGCSSLNKKWKKETVKNQGTPAHGCAFCYNPCWGS